MTISANKGDHSEVLALLRILHQGEIPIADKNGKPLKSRLKVLSLYRPSDKGQKYEIGDDSVRVVNELGLEIALVSRDKIKNLSDNLLKEIRTLSGRSFVCPSTDEASKILHFSGSKASSSEKADLFLEIASPVFEGETSSLGFSVKSELGALPTLLNAGATKFEYRIDDCSADKAFIVQEELPKSEKKEYPGPSLLLPALTNSHAKIVFESVVSPIFEQNLKMIDSAFPRILADTLKHSYISGEGSLNKVVKSTALIDELTEVLSIPRANVERLVPHKIKELLRQSALGMNPGRPWEGQTEAHGGWIIVKEDGSVVCFHLHNDDEFRDFLLENTKFDTPSMTRHEAGFVYKEAGSNKAKLRLSLQIRLD